MLYLLKARRFKSVCMVSFSRLSSSALALMMMMMTMRFLCGVVQDGYLSYFQDQEEAEVYRSKDGDSEFHHHPSSQRQLSLDCVEAVRTEVRGGRGGRWYVCVCAFSMCKMTGSRKVSVLSKGIETHPKTNVPVFRTVLFCTDHGIRLANDTEVWYQVSRSKTVEWFSDRRNIFW